MAGMLAPARMTAPAELVSVPDAPLQVVVGAGELCTLRFAGMVSVNPACVSAKPFVFLKVMVSVEDTFTSTLAGENASVTVGATGVTVIEAGHALAALPADDGACMIAGALADAKETNAVLSVWPAASRTARFRVPAPVTATDTCAEFVGPAIATAPVVVHE